MNDLKGIIEDCNKSDLVSDKVIKKIIEIIGQEKWQNLHDENSDVCTTMGELIINLDRITDLEKENAELKSRDCWKSCEYANPKAELIAQHIKDVQQLTKAKEILKGLYFIIESRIDYKNNIGIADEMWRAKQFLSEVEK